MAESICLVCGYEGKPRKIKRGTRGMEIFIWTVLLIPGPIYSVWRRVGLPRICLNCKMDKMVSINSDAGMIKQQQMDAEMGLILPRAQASVVMSDKSHSVVALPENTTDKRTIDPDVW